MVHVAGRYLDGDGLVGIAGQPAQRQPDRDTSLRARETRAGRNLLTERTPALRIRLDTVKPPPVRLPVEEGVALPAERLREKRLRVRRPVHATSHDRSS